MATLTDSVVVNRGGRPRSFQEPGVSVSAWIPASSYDAIVKTAQQQEKSVSALVRDLLTIRPGPAGFSTK